MESGTVALAGGWARFGKEVSKLIPPIVSLATELAYIL
jgi:hypothetical protein